MPTVEIFYCYDQKDQALRDELAKHLVFMKRQNLMTDWYDQNISPGQHREAEIAIHLNTAHIILLLISSDFMISSECNSIMQRALQRHQSGEVQIIPILLRSVTWNSAPFNKFQVLPTNQIPVKSWASVDEAFTGIAKDIRKAVENAFIDQLKEESFQDFLEKQYLVALGAYERAIELRPDTAFFFQNKGDALYALKQYEEALHTYQEAVRLDPENATSHNGQGKTLYQLQDYEAALASQNEAIRINPHLAEAYRERAMTLEALATQARHKADGIETYREQAMTPNTSATQTRHKTGEVKDFQPDTHLPPPLPEEKEKNFVRLTELIRRGKLRTGERVYVPQRPDQLATILDGRNVEFQGKRCSINEWAKKMTGWSAVNIYERVYLERTRQPLGKLREE